MQNPIDEKFSKLYKESKEIIKKVNKLMLDYKKIDDNLNLGFINEDFINLTETNISECNELENKIMQTSQRIVIFGSTSVGKSSFINALLFQSEILPVGSASKTKCFLEINHSKTDINYLTVNDEIENIQNIKNILCDKKNRDLPVKLFYNFNERNSFGNNIVIDTPGIDFSKHYDEKILNYCNEADIFILVINASTYFGKNMKKFCQKFKTDFSQINIYVIFNYFDVVQSRDDWCEGIEESIERLLKIFPTTSREKMAFISSHERMAILTQNKDVSNDELAKYRNESFEELIEKLKNERGHVSLVGRYACLLNTLEIMIKNQLCLSQMIDEQFIFFDINIRMLSNLPLFINEINKIVLSYCENILKTSREIIGNEQRNNTTNDVDTIPLNINGNLNDDDDDNNNHGEHSENKYILSNEQSNNTTNDSDEACLIIEEQSNDDDAEQLKKQIQQEIQLLLSKVENEIKQKVMEEIISYFSRNKGNDKNKIIFVMKNIYFRKIINKTYLFDSKKVIECVKKKSSKVKIAIGASTGGLALGAVLLTIPFWPVMLPLELAAGATAIICSGGALVGMTVGGGLGAVSGKVINELSKKYAEFEIKSLFKTFAKDLVKDFSNFEMQKGKYLNLAKRKQQIKKQIDDFEIKMVLFQITGNTIARNEIDNEFVKLYKESKEIIEKMNEFLIIYKHIDNDLNIDLGNEEFLKLLKSDMKNCKNLGMKLMNNSKKIVFFGESNSGKSSLINALIFQSNVLPEGPDSSTKCFVEIKRSMYHDNYLIVDEQRKSIANLQEIITKVENKERDIYLFQKFDKGNIFSNHVIIDTPGISCDDYYGHRMSKYLKEADFIILVINVLDNPGQIIKEFIKRFDIELQGNLHVIFTFCENFQTQSDCKELVKDKITFLTEIFPTADRAKMIFISSLEIKQIIEKKIKPFVEHHMNNKNDSFKKFCEQIKSKSDEISFHYRHDYLSKISEILNNKQLRFSKILKERNPFPDVDFDILLEFSFEEEIEEIVKSFYIKFLLVTCKDIDNNYENITQVETVNQDILGRENVIQSDETVMKTLIKETENEIKQKIKEKITNYIDRNNSNYQYEMKAIVHNIYFPKVIDKKQFVYSGDILEDAREITGKIKTALKDCRDATHICVKFTKIPPWSVLIPIKLATSILTGTNVEIQTVNGVCEENFEILIEHNKLGNSMKKFGNDLINSFSNFLISNIRLNQSDCGEIELQITERIAQFTKNVSSFKQKYLK